MFIAVSSRTASRKASACIEVNAVGSPDTTPVRLPLPGVYVGQFKDGKLSGQGAVIMPSAGYFGAFSDNMFKPNTVEKSGS